MEGGLAALFLYIGKARTSASQALGCGRAYRRNEGGREGGKEGGLYIEERVS